MSRVAEMNKSVNDVFRPLVGKTTVLLGQFIVAVTTLLGAGFLVKTLFGFFGGGFTALVLAGLVTGALLWLVVLVVKVLTRR